MPKRDVTPAMVESVRAWLGEDGIAFFRECQRDHGTVSPVLVTKLESGRNFPHMVHFREGMQVRNHMRTIPDCDGWDSNDLDDTWQAVVEQAIAEAPA